MTIYKEYFDYTMYQKYPVQLILFMDESQKQDAFKCSVCSSNKITHFMS